MIKKIITLTTLLLGGIMIGSLKGQQRQDDINEITNPYEYEAAKEEAVKHEEPQHDPCAEQRGKYFIRFWRMKLDGGSGMWHLFNEEDRKFLDDVQRRIKSGQYVGKIEWFEFEGRLPQ
jgi:hypothetical protein